MFRCTRCNHTFSRGSERSQPRPTRPRREDPNLTLPFEAGGEATAAAEGSPPRAADPTASADGPRATDDGPIAEQELPDEPQRTGEPAFVSDLPRERTPRPAAARAVVERTDGLRRRAAHARPDDDDLDAGPTEADETADDEASSPLLVSEPERARRAPIQPRRRAPGAPRHSPLKPVGAGVAVLVLAFLVLAVVLERQPDSTLQRLGRVPLLGRLVGDDHLLVWRVQISDVEGTVDRIKGDRPALVVSGRVLNASNQNLRLIEIEGRLLADGVERRRQMVFAANQFRKTIRDLSASEVEMLLRLEPNRRFVVRPGESASFLLVFPDPPPNATEITCRVVDARAT